MAEKIHFIAIGGSVMHQLALALQQKGYEVSGSDDDFYEPALSNLRNAGLLSAPGWHPERITANLDAVILGMHARPDNPELLEAQDLNIPVYSFPEYIYRESINKTRVVIGGSHGKTTITSMIMHVLREAGKDFDYLAGAKIPGFERSVKISNAPLIVCEGDEYPASAMNKIPKFLFYHPQIAVLSGIAWDHINVFPTFENYLEQFALFIRQMEAGSCLIYNEEDENLVRLVEKEGKKLELWPYSVPKHEINDGITTVYFDGLSAPLQVFGMHNLQNIYAALLVCKKIGVDTKPFLHAISLFKGASQRLEKVFEKPGAALFRDFAHAPSKVKASIHAVKEQFPNRKLVAVLELHTYSSLNKTFLPQYAHSMEEADSACVFYSHHALEIKHLPPLSREQIKDGFEQKELTVITETNELKNFISNQSDKDTNLLMMSSGNFGGLSKEEVIELWQKHK